MNTSLLARVYGTLTTAGIRSALIGAGALAVHGVSRSTFDRDLLVVDKRALERQTWATLPETVSIDIRRGDAEDPLEGVIRLSSGAERVVDVIVGRHRWQFRLLEEASAVETPDATLSVVSAPGLVLLKLYAGGPQDLWDIEQLRSVHGKELDAAVDAGIHALPADARETWRRVRGA